MTWVDGISSILIALGVLFYIAGTVGLLRFPDVFSRLHALTKADNLGLGLVVFGVALLEQSLATTVKLVVVWLFVMTASATSCFLVAQAAREDAHASEIDEARAS